MSWFASSAPTGPNIHPVQLSIPDTQAAFGPLTPQDNEWLLPSGIATETQTFYATLKDGSLLMAQVIHSSIGALLPRNIQFTFRHADGKGKNTFKSVGVHNFKVAPTDKLDKRSCKSDEFSITVDPSTPNKITVEGKYDDDVQVSLVFEQLAAGFKLGAGPKGGFTYYGQDTGKESKGDAPNTVAGADGYCVHRFWPRCKVSGILRSGKDVVDLEGARGIFIHAIQGLRPNLLASTWNFGNFQTVGSDDGVALIQMEFTTTPTYGSKIVNIGAVVVGDKLISVTAGGDGIVGGSSCTHENKVIDKETGYEAPAAIKWVWEGAALEGEGSALKAIEGANNKVHAVLTEDLLISPEGYQTKGLIEKVDFLAQVPYIIKKAISYASGLKPYIYTWLNPVTASITIGTGSETKTIDVSGYIFNEVSYVTE